MENGDVAVQQRSEGAELAPNSRGPLGDFVQAHLGRASKFADGKTRNWSVFFFFRIMAQAEIDADVNRVGALLRALAKKDDPSGQGASEAQQALLAIMTSLKDPALMNARLVRQKLKNRKHKENSEASRDVNTSDPPAGGPGASGETSDQPPAPPAKSFLGWLDAAAHADFGQLKSTWKEFLSEAISGPGGNAEEAVGLSTLLRGAWPPRDELKQRIEAVLTGLYDDPSTSVADTSVKQMWFSLTGLQPPAELSAWPELEWLLLISIVFIILAEIPSLVAKIFDDFAHRPGEAGRRALTGGLPGLCLYEVLRQLRPALPRAAPVRGGKTGANLVVPPIARSEAAERHFFPSRGELTWDPCPVNYVFTYSGLNALNLDPITLASFPDAFTAGMAARAERLGDTGPSAPQYWDGPLGINSVDDTRSIHGYFTGGFLVGDDKTPVKASLWQALRDEAGAFNERSEQGGLNLRLILNLLFRGLGLEIMHIEIGEFPYAIKDDCVHREPYRKEHFGFADGISQPFAELDIGLPDPPPGGGTPAPNRTWAPVAPGEIYLGEPDEDGNIAKQPLNCLLRRGSTYLVFRKLEQQVPQFRTYLRKQRPKDPDAMWKLASEFVGRWPNGAPLVVAPNEELGLGDHPDQVINNFLYAADDPNGEKCPLGAHIRRTNPRDIGGTNEARRHRILRRSISYGGHLLPETSIGDGRKRGLLFIAVNSSIDIQFEVIQARWINTGEFLGQAGLNRCPITGANEGRPQDAFLEAGAVAPVVDLPRFVITRGGDYFFAPGVDALNAIAHGCKFPVGGAKVPCDGFSMGDAYTPSLFNPVFDPDRLPGYVEEILDRQLNTPVIRVAMPNPDSADSEEAHPDTKAAAPNAETASAGSEAPRADPRAEPVDPCAAPGDPESVPVAFVGRYADVVEVLRLAKDDKPVIFSVAPYREAARRISRGHDLLVGTEPGCNSTTSRNYHRMLQILDAAWCDLDEPKGTICRGLETITKKSLDATFRRAGPSGTIDFVNDVAVPTVYGLLVDIFGIPGPDWLTEIAVALPFYRQHFGELPPDWLKSVKAAPPANPSIATLQTWSNLLVLDLVDNFAHQQEVMALSDQAGGEFLEYLDSLLLTARAKASAPPRTPRLLQTPKTLVDTFVANEVKFVWTQTQKLYSSPEEYYYDVSMLLMELAASAMGFIPATFGFVMSNLLDFGIILPNLIPILLAPPSYPNVTAAEKKDDVVCPAKDDVVYPPKDHVVCPPKDDAGCPPKEDGVARLIYETCRLAPPIPILMRRCWRDFTFDGGGSVHACNWVAAMVGGAGVDPCAFDDPSAFSLYPFLPGPVREIDKYLLFGVTKGGRKCWGKHRLALFVLEECVKAAGRLQNLRKIAGASPIKTIADVSTGLKAHFDFVLPDWP